MLCCSCAGHSCNVAQCVTNGSICLFVMAESLTSNVQTFYGAYSLLHFFAMLLPLSFHMCHWQCGCVLNVIASTVPHVSLTVWLCHLCVSQKSWRQSCEDDVQGAGRTDQQGWPSSKSLLLNSFICEADFFLFFGGGGGGGLQVENIWCWCFPCSSRSSLFLCPFIAGSFC